MRSGKTWVATNYHCHQSQKFYFKYTLKEKERKFHVKWYMTTVCNDGHTGPTYYLCNGTQKLVVNGKTKVNLGSSYKASGKGTVYRGFADNGSYLDKHYNKRTFFDTNGDYVGIRRWVYIMGHNWTSGSFDIPAKSDGSAKFSVNGSFRWYGKTLTFKKTFTIQDSKLKKTYKISYDSNISGLLDGDKSVSNIPKTQTKTHGVNIKVSKTVPVISTGNYVFSHWATARSSSFSPAVGAKIYKSNDTISTDSNLTLYAIWAKKKYTVTVDLSNYSVFNSTIDSWISEQQNFYSIKWVKDSNTKIYTTVDYGDEIDIPNSCVDAIYGKYLSSWESETQTYQIVNSQTKLFVDKNIILKPNFVPSTFNINLLTYPNYNPNEKLRTISCKYEDTIQGNIVYNGSIPAGCEFIGWSVNKIDKPINPDSNLPIVDDKIFKSTYDAHQYYMNTLYLGIDDIQISRKYMYGEDINLYPVFRFLTSFYIYTNGEWKLALPFLQYNDTWKISLGNIYSNDDTWHK